MKYTQISLKLPEEVLDKVDSVAKNKYKKRSEIMREALVEYVAVHNEAEKVLSGKERIKKLRSLMADIGPTHAAKEHDTVF
jgi:metal-responsive CopG/Arc/MetJ family transcriptional regulator